VRELAILVLSLFSLTLAPAPQGHDGHGAVASTSVGPARRAFDRFRSIAGEWSATSTKGWTERLSYRTIAAGSTVIEMSDGAHPDEIMATMFHMDGERLLLTHYCVAGNQPRLEATGFADDGRTVTFTFVDGTNMQSRDTGHMDTVVFKFLDDGRLVSQWTWYQQGTSRWMEEVTATRVTKR
jgi:hypothetical protein